MQIPPVTSSPSAASDSSASAALGGDMGDMFLKLLTTQLKAQDPISPMDPTAFVGQLVQFNTLGQIVQIRELLQQSTDAKSAAAPATSATGGI